MQQFNNNIFIQSGCTIDLNNIDYNKINDEETNHDYIESLNLLASDAGVSRFYLYPNFNIGGFLGPQGYVAEIHGSKYFSYWMFSQPMFRVISFFEIKYKSNINDFCKDNDIKDLIRLSIPLETPTFPKITDTVDGDWTPALGHNGCSIGIYSSNEKGAIDQINRYFIGVHSGLHYQTDRELHNELMKYAHKNFELLNRTDIADNNVKTELRTIHNVFTEKLLINAKNLSKENNRRLATSFAKILDLEFLKAEPTTILGCKTMFNAFTDTVKHTDLVYKALNWWPSNKILYLDNVIEYEIDEENIDEKIYERIKFKPNEKMPIGVLYKQSRDDMSRIASNSINANNEKQTEHTMEKINAFKKKYSAPLIENRETILPCVECDYNTFRVINDYMYYFNNCSCTLPNIKEPNLNCIKQLSLTQGYEIYNSRLTQVFDYEQNNAKTWTNDFGNGFPVVYPQMKRPDTLAQFNSDTLNIFFSYFCGGSQESEHLKIPKQLQYIPKMRSINDDSLIQKDLYNADFKPGVVQLLPNFVYLSPDIPFDSNKI